jgi:hypothetical protein
MHEAERIILKNRRSHGLLFNNEVQIVLDRVTLAGELIIPKKAKS